MAITINGRVLDAAGQPVAGAVVAVADSDQPHREIGARTGADGSFRLNGLLAGRYRLEAHHEGARGEVATTLSEGDESVEISLG